MNITKQAVADQLGAYLRHDITVAQLVDWAQTAASTGQFEGSDAAVLGSVLRQIGDPQVRAFGLGYADCEHLLRELGYSAHTSKV